MSRSARNKMMDLLAQRDHSEKELRTKLRQRDFAEEEIEAALQTAKDSGWILPENELSQKYAHTLHRKGKGIQTINRQLQEKGLPTIVADPEQEFAKALQLVQQKFPRLHEQDRATKAKAYRFLQARGYSGETLRKVVFFEPEEDNIDI